MRPYRLLVTSFVLKACIFSLVQTSEILPEKEMMELDLFMQSETYGVNSRTKRTENDTSGNEPQDVAEGSATGDLAQSSTPLENPDDENKDPDQNTNADISPEPIPTTPASTTQSNIDNVGNENTALPIANSPEPNLQSSDSNGDALGAASPAADSSNPTPESNSSKENVVDAVPPTTPIPTQQNNNPNEESVGTPPPTADSSNATPGNDNSPGTTTNNALTDKVETPPPEGTDNAPESIDKKTTNIPAETNTNMPLMTTEYDPANYETDITEVNTEAVTANPEGVVPAIDVRSGISPDDDNSFRNATEIGINDTKPGITGKHEEKPTGVKVVIDNNPISSEVNKTISRNETKTDIKGPKSGNATNTLKSETATDKPNKSSVSSSGVFFTILAVIIIAALGGAAYYMYKKRQQNYDPVATEERDKEMIEVINENGYGKPISAEEIKLNDQITPTEPKPTPRTFIATPTDEKSLENLTYTEEKSLEVTNTDEKKLEVTRIDENTLETVVSSDKKASENVTPSDDKTLETVRVIKDYDEDRDRREHSVEYEEETNKKDGQ
ncbi:hypothetical protein Trydic_g4718 [Trypoxylus dichotomus]